MKQIELKLLDFFDIGNRVGKINLARKKLMINFILGLVLSKSVNFSKIAEHFNPDVQLASHVRRIERFFKEYELDYIQIGVMLCCFLPPGRISLSIDRSNWKLGATDINYLTITAYCKGVGVPLVFDLLDKKGNSNTAERIALMKKLFRVVPKKQILAFCADREFIGEKWYKFLINNNIPFYIRIKKDHRITFNGVAFAAKHFAVSRKKRVYEHIKIHGLSLRLAAKTIPNQKDEEDKYLLILTNADVHKALDIYRQRWSIEVFFQSIKKRGFNIEDTSVDEPQKLKKLFALVSLAFACCLQIGIWKRQKEKPMKKRKNGYKPKSFFRYGLNEIRKALLHFHTKANRAFYIMDNLIRQLIENLQMWQVLNFILRI